LPGSASIGQGEVDTDDPELGPIKRALRGDDATHRLEQRLPKAAGRGRQDLDAGRHTDQVLPGIPTTRRPAHVPLPGEPGAPQPPDQWHPRRLVRHYDVRL
jgi:hypothetical protein